VAKWHWTKKTLAFFFSVVGFSWRITKFITHPGIWVHVQSHKKHMDHMRSSCYSIFVAHERSELKIGHDWYQPHALRHPRIFLDIQFHTISIL
jgi:hypothetical protein